MRCRLTLPTLFAAMALAVTACGAEEPATQAVPTTGSTAGSSPTAPATAGTGMAGATSSGMAGRSAPVGMAGRTGGAAGATPVGGAAGMVAAGSTGAATAGTAGDVGMAGTGAAGMDAPDAGPAAGDATMPMGTGTCCPDGDCICRGEPPSALTAENGPYQTDSYSVAGTGCVYYPTDGEPPYSAVAISDGFVGTGGCGATQTNRWGPLYASHGIVAMIVETGSLDQPPQRGMALTEGIATFKAENEKSDSPLYQKLAGRYGTSGFSMGGGGTTYATQEDPTLLSSVAIMPWGPVRDGIEVPTLIICGSSDGTASCGSHGTPAYAGIADSVPKMRVTVSSGHAGQPTAGGDDSGKYGLAWQKVFLDGDTRWRTLLVSAETDESNVK
jgi:hypothetical protein